MQILFSNVTKNGLSSDNKVAVETLRNVSNNVKKLIVLNKKIVISSENEFYDLINKYENMHTGSSMDIV